jgi:hypothetical protein
MLLKMRAIVAAGLAVALMAGACGAGSPASTGPSGPTGPSPSLPGTPGHFDNGEFSFDYPTDWPIIASGFSSDKVEYVFMVVGDGTWKDGCVYTSNSSACGPDTFDVPPGRIVVKIYRWWGGPVVMCQGDTQANATFGTLAVRVRVKGAWATWEIRVPGNEFGQNNNIFIEAHTADAVAMARAVALISSFRWEPGAYGNGMCSSPSIDAAASAS